MMIRKENKFKLINIFLCIVILVSVSSIELFSSQAIDNIYKELATLNANKSAKRLNYNKLSDRLYKIYEGSPKGQDADQALLASARVLRASYNRFKVREDADKAFRIYRLLQNSFSSMASKDAYLECAEMYLTFKDSASAKFILNKLINKYPKTTHATKAEKILRNLDSNKPATPTVRNNVDKPQTNVDKVVRMAEPKEEVKTGNVQVNGVRYFSDKDYTRVVIDISETAKIESRWLKEDPSIKKPPRLTIDILSSTLANNIVKDIPIKDGLLSSVRVGYHAPEKRTRIVLDSENVKDFTVFQMPNPNRIVVDVFSADRAKQIDAKPKVAVNNDKPVTAPKDNKRTTDNDDIKMTLGAALGLKVKTIVIDAGHGGKDPGAMYNKLKEKDVVLDIAKKVRDMLKKDKSLTVYMTRDKDIFIPLEERTAIANKHNADLFISIHANAARNQRASGVETFVFNVTNDKAALEVASFENQATTKSISDLQGILKDILRYSKLEESLLLAGYVQKTVVRDSGLKKEQNLGVKQAPFYVLVGATMPSILIEVGFLSNSNDATRLGTDEYRDKVAEGIYNGLSDYISKYNGQ